MTEFAALLEIRKPTAAVIALRRKGVAQQPVDALPGGEHLRAFDLSVSAPSRVDDLARAHGDAERVGREAERAQPLDQLVLGNDAGAAAGQFAAHPFVNINAPAGAAQQKAAEQPTHGAADDNGAFLRSVRHLICLKLSVGRKMLYTKVKQIGGIGNGSDHAR